VARGDHATALAPRRAHVHTEENPVSPGFLLRALKITVDLGESSLEINGFSAAHNWESGAR
jgi:hypothetical protein